MFNNSSLEADSMNSTSVKQNDLKVSSVSDIIKEGNKDAAAIKVQKVYRSYRTRRNLADGAVPSDELWWHTIDSIMLEQNLLYDISKPVTAIARLSRASLGAARVGKGLSKDENARELAGQHWLEAIDPRHRYGRNLHMYYEEWSNCDTVQPFFHWLDIGGGRDLNLQECPRSTLNRELIKYLSPKEREHYEVIPQNGKLIYKQSGQLIDTTEGSGESHWIFVISTSKKLYVGKVVSWKGCKGVTRDGALEAIMDIVQVNPWLEEIDLNVSLLQASGKTDRVHQRLGQNASAKPQIDFLKDMPMTVPKSAKVFLCGQEFAGKIYDFSYSPLINSYCR